MALKTKLVKDVDDNIWRLFTAWCLGKKVKVGQKLTEILRDFLKKNR